MRDDGAALLELAGRVSDGAPVDWEAVERRSSGEARRVVRQLRILESIASLHREGESSSSGGRDPARMSDSVDPLTLANPAPGRAPDGATPSPVTVRRWGRLEVRERLGRGAFGDVYRAWDGNLDREVALKLVEVDELGDRECVDGLIREGRVLARVRHENVVTVHGADEHDGTVGLWMELVRGRTLSDLVAEQGRMGAQEASAIGRDLCRALAAVHQAGLIHGDVKAANVMREEGGRILLMDFGAGREQTPEAERSDRISGTPTYLAPEVLRDGTASRRSDIYSLGVLLFHLVTGRYPIEARSLRELREKHRQGATRLLRDERPDLPDRFVAVVERALAPDPEQRFATVGQMELALAAPESRGEWAEDRRAGSSFGDHGPVERSRRRRWVVVAAVVLVSIAIGVALWKLVPSFVADQSGTPAEVAAVPVAYTVEGHLMRAGRDGRRERLESGARLALQDSLTLRFRASRPLFVYVINEDEQGRAHVLFPLPDFDLENPLPGGRSHELPGTRNGRSISWVVDSPGGREHLLILASPERPAEFEAVMAALPPVQPGQTALPLSEEAKLRLRGIGSWTERPEAAPEGAAGRLFEMAAQLADESEVVRGVWVRRIELENPAE
jgi:serine/threonine-protein kinase